MIPRRKRSLLSPTLSSTSLWRRGRRDDARGFIRTVAESRERGSSKGFMETQAEARLPSKTRETPVAGDSTAAGLSQILTGR